MSKHCRVRSVRWHEEDPKDPGELSDTRIWKKLKLAKVALNWSTFNA